MLHSGDNLATDKVQWAIVLDEEASEFGLGNLPLEKLKETHDWYSFHENLESSLLLNWISFNISGVNDLWAVLYSFTNIIQRPLPFSFFW